MNLMYYGTCKKSVSKHNSKSSPIDGDNINIIYKTKFTFSAAVHKDELHSNTSSGNHLFGGRTLQQNCRIWPLNHNITIQGVNPKSSFAHPNPVKM